MSDTAKVGKTSKEHKGRSKGTPNKRTHDVIERLKELKCDPIEGMAKIAAEAMKEGEDRDLSLAGQMYKELAQYIAPKRKAIEMDVTGNLNLYIPIIKRFDGTMDEIIDE